MNFWDGGIVDTKEKTSILFSKKFLEILSTKGSYDRCWGWGRASNIWK